MTDQTFVDRSSVTFQAQAQTGRSSEDFESRLQQPVLNINAVTVFFIKTVIWSTNRIGTNNFRIKNRPICSMLISL